MDDEENGEMVDLETTAEVRAERRKQGKSGGGKKKARKRARRRRMLIAIAAIAAVLIAGLATLAIVFGLQARHEHHLNGLRKSASRAAESYALDLSTYDYRHLDENFGVVRAHLDPTFQAKWDQSTSTLKAVVVQRQGVATATVIESAVQSISSSHAVVLVFLNQQLTNNVVKSQLNADRLQVSLVRKGGTWLMSDLQLK